MRPVLRQFAWGASLVVLCSLTAGLHAGQDRLTASPAATVKNASTKPDKSPTWIVEGSWKRTRDEAVADALNAAREKVLEYLRGQRPPVLWEPSVDYVREHLVRDLKVDEPVFKDKVGEVALVKIGDKTGQALEQRKDFEHQSDMHQVCVKVSLTAKDREAIQRLDRVERAEYRQLGLIKLLAALVAALAAVAGYFRLEEATKGYYTTWLRLATIGFVGVVGVALWLFSGPIR